MTETHKSREAGLILRSMVLCAVTAGFRRSEALNLVVSDLDLDHGRLWVQDKPETEHTWAWTPKDGDSRLAPMIADLSTTVSQIIAELPAGQPYVHLTGDRFDYLQYLRRHGRMTDRQRLVPDDGWDERFRRAVRASGAPSHLTYHDLRRTFASVLAEEGVDIYAIAEVLGHGDIRTTREHYLAVNHDQMLGRAAEAVTQRLRSGT